MALILNLETATKVCSVALCKDGEVIAIKEHHGEYAHAEKLTVFVLDLLNQTNLSFKQLDAVAVSSGPGSYTGLRIGVSAAKGFSYALDIPLIGIETLQQMALFASLNHKNKTPDNALFFPMIDARRMEVYCAVYDMENNLIEKTQAKIIDADSFQDLLHTNTVYFFGDGAFKCKEILGSHPNAVFLDAVFPSAAAMASLSEKSFVNKDFQDTAYFEPYYLKDFISTIPKKKF
ncbi:MAG: tRNA (adenosine(37)-N6)-threonylcarbamoyltransferase complex dimerization subunit type 1 TsaB [Bacteroidota bacterium]|nr:tRNA (adenosine(37)-N6)-threonylcarbamoyltransferase complex dimerization subunit type 1 TsaB [Bacteroidota bacterium]